jgi:hypothetical protein
LSASKWGSGEGEGVASAPLLSQLIEPVASTAAAMAFARSAFTLSFSRWVDCCLGDNNSPEFLASSTSCSNSASFCFA